jgi:hypothetical protein
MSSAPVFALVAFLTVADAGAQIAQGIIHGAVIGPDDRPVDEAVVTLLDPLGNAVKSTTVRNGVFQLAEIAPGTYSLRADAPPLHAFVPKVTISTALPVRIDLRVTAVASEQVIVRGQDTEPVSTTTRVTLAGESVRRVPARLRSRGLARQSSALSRSRPSRQLSQSGHDLERRRPVRLESVASEHAHHCDWLRPIGLRRPE